MPEAISTLSPIENGRSPAINSIRSPENPSGDQEKHDMIYHLEKQTGPLSQEQKAAIDELPDNLIEQLAQSLRKYVLSREAYQQPATEIETVLRGRVFELLATSQIFHN